MSLTPPVLRGKEVSTIFHWIDCRKNYNYTNLSDADFMLCLQATPGLQTGTLSRLTVTQTM